MTIEEVREHLRVAIRNAGTARAWCKRHNEREPNVSNFLAGRREATPAILDALNLERVVSYRPKG